MQNRKDLIEMIESRQSIGLLDFQLFFEGVKKVFGIQEVYHTKMRVTERLD